MIPMRKANGRRVARGVRQSPIAMLGGSGGALGALAARYYSYSSTQRADAPRPPIPANPQVACASRCQSWPSRMQREQLTPPLPANAGHAVEIGPSCGRISSLRIGPLFWLPVLHPSWQRRGGTDGELQGVFQPSLSSGRVHDGRVRLLPGREEPRFRVFEYHTGEPPGRKCSRIDVDPVRKHLGPFGRCMPVNDDLSEMGLAVQKLIPNPQ
jgi:hypothetical protein